MAISCVVFAWTAAEFYWVATSDSTATYAEVLSVVVSEEFAFGAGSGWEQMSPYWKNMPAFNQVVLGVHAVLASLALAIGSPQFLPVVRRRWPHWHRQLGRLYAVLVMVSMVCAFVYLIVTPMDKIYGGAPFAIGLWGIAVLTTYTLVAAVVHIIRGEVVQHRTTMVLNFAVMLIAPLLRFWWMFLGRVFRDQGIDQATAHVAVLMFLGLQVIVGAIVVLHLQSDSLDSGDTALVSNVRAWFLAHRLQWMVALGCGGLIAVGACMVPILVVRGDGDIFAATRAPVLALRDAEVYATHWVFFWLRSLGLALVGVGALGWIGHLFDGQERAQLGRAAPFLVGNVLTITGWIGLAHGFGANGVGGVGGAVFHLSLAAAVLVILALWIQASRKQNLRQLKEMSLHLFALCMTPATQLVAMSMFLGAGFDWTAAFLSSAVLAPTVNLSMSFYYTVYGGRALRMNQRTAIAA
jgi:uncharacterized membrane protein YozB (DUF420 family)